MMREILGVTDEASVHRRWFHDDYFDLFVWQAENGEIVQFQLCYGIDSSEQALVWHKQSGYFLDGVKAGKSAGSKTPTIEAVLEAPGGVALALHPVMSVARRATTIEPVRRIIRTPLAESRGHW